MNDMPRITQEMIDLYDHFTHVSADKAAYLDKLTSLVGSRETAELITSLIAANKMSAPHRGRERSAPDHREGHVRREHDGLSGEAEERFGQAAHRHGRA